VQRFQDDDAGYLAWVHQHPDGFVVNSDRHSSPRYLVLHRADCTFITRPSQEGHWTVAYIKVCGRDVAELERWAKAVIGGRLQPCSWCAPGS
jgi:hypothetical protein